MKSINMITTISLSLIILGFIFWNTVYQNSDSKNLIFAFSAVVGAICMFYLNMVFELKDTTEQHVIRTQVSIFHEKPEVAQYFYPPSSGGRIHIDIKASEWLASRDKDIFSSTPEKVMKDLILYSLTGFFVSEEMDWKRTAKRFVHSHHYSFRTNPEAKGLDSFISKEQIYKNMKSSGNLYGQVELKTISKGIFMPPETKLEVKADGLLISNPFCNLFFQIEESGSVSYMKPGSRVAQVESLPDGRNKHETRYYNINVDIKFKGNRAKNKNMPNYKDWTQRLVGNLRNWFELAESSI